MGDKTFSRIVSSMRANNNPISTDNHKYDKHFKKWCEGKTPEEIAKTVNRSKQTDSTKALTKPEAKKALQKIRVLKAKVKPVPITRTKRDKLKEKFLKQQRKEFEDKFKTSCRCSHIKSAGNGL